MRKIDKGPCPAVLSKNGLNDLHRMELELSRGDDSKADETIYAHHDVKDSLKTSHRQKCAYCERFLNGDYGDVEHFRPKKGYINTQTGQLNKPGYWWLAYDWDNLLLSCSECNRSYKRNHFPLGNENQRNIAGKDISQEKPLLINPAIECPSDYLEFNRWVVRPTIINGAENPKGAKTIELLQLNNRPELVQKREVRWKWVETARKKGIDVTSWIGEDQEFTGMFQCQVI